ncbi:MAG: hypothetical protein GDA43_00415 [Hormoscilla sp. SP5CHS1]|nr:hypothetical protein [Hormoscilla sp. SP12CHS1]MBC6451834.1 hypothetical protein [Hormoscilla sp. SP5CHS1]MBC6475766.1 hypothetical protein [Hormoscilla sp. GM102CHS1]
MLSQQQTAKNIDLWQSVVTRELAYIQSRQEFLKGCTERVAIVQKRLQNHAERGTALRMFFYLALPERQSLLDELVDLASVSHTVPEKSDIKLCREAILSLPKT